eukprot:TRINITY_DN71481_c0_g1_i1.p1 TRINITY_DN71481_c0_g1~~TRINITY_DN71481_c0_g1_i1.p1  ORF type:complete len:459 (-),score=86.79 TRINITY_DN71481_c0_g1_i1:37-1383(-)
MASVAATGENDKNGGGCCKSVSVRGPDGRVLVALDAERVQSEPLRTLRRDVEVKLASSGCSGAVRLYFDDAVPPEHVPLADGIAAITGTSSAAAPRAPVAADDGIEPTRAGEEAQGPLELQAAVDRAALVATVGDDFYVRIWDGETGAQLRSVNVDPTRLARPVAQGTAPGITAAAVAPSGSRALIGYRDRCVRMWDLDNGEVAWASRGHTGAVHATAFSEDGCSCATGAEDLSVKLWDVYTGYLLRTVDGHTSYIRALAFSLDGRWLASAGVDATVQLFDALAGAGGDRGQPCATMRGHADEVLAITFSRCSSAIASASADGTARLWDPSSGKCLRVLAGHGGAVRACRFDLTSEVVLTASDDSLLRLWACTSGEPLLTFGCHSQMRVASFSPVGRTILTAGFDGAAKIWDVETGTCSRTLALNAEKGTTALPHGAGRVLAATFVAY